MTSTPDGTVRALILLLLDPVLLTFDPGCQTQKAKFGGKLFPAQSMRESTGTVCLDFFQTHKETRQPKGIVALD